MTVRVQPRGVPEAGGVDRSPPLLELRDLGMHFPITRGVLWKRRTGTVKAVDGVSFALRQGETVGLVGESGCGKTTVGRCIVRLYRATSGQVILDGKDIGTLGGPDLLGFRRRVQMVFQDPYSSLNPRMTVRDALAEPLEVHGLASGRGQRDARIEELLGLVGLASEHASRYPHEFSGGQRQRIGIARALAVEPDFIVCDEPVSALDVSIQAQILNLLRELQRRLGLTFLFIAHDLSVVRHVSDWVAVMYLGRIVEFAPRDALFARPAHPYTRALLSAIPVPDPDVEASRRRIILAGDAPSPINPPTGCNFHPRCPWATPICAVEVPVTEVVSGGHRVACHNWRDLGTPLPHQGASVTDGNTK